MHAHDPVHRVDGHQGAVHGSARGSTLHDPHVGECAGIPNGFYDLPELGSVDLYGLVDVAGEGLLLVRVLPGR